MKMNQNGSAVFAQAETGNSESRVFLDSLAELQVTDLADRRRQPKETPKKKTRWDLASIALLLACAVVFVYCAVQIVFSLFQDQKSNTLYEDYSDKFRDLDPDDVSVYSLTPAAAEKPMKNFASIAAEGADIYDPNSYNTNTVKSQKLLKMLVFLDELKRENTDIYGYITVDDTVISYPIVQGEDNDFYLYHGFDRNYLKSGSIFADWRNSRVLTDNRNLVLYGHNMSTGSMFHDLIKYLEEDFFMSKPVIITTFDAIYTFEVFSIHETLSNVNYYRTSFTGDSDFIEFCQKQEALSKFHKKGIEFNEDSVILTLSTCINNGVNVNGRYAIHAILVKTER